MRSVISANLNMNSINDLESVLAKILTAVQASFKQTQEQIEISF
jgi:hypothetical protein